MTQKNVTRSLAWLARSKWLACHNWCLAARVKFCRVLTFGMLFVTLFVSPLASLLGLVKSMGKEVKMGKKKEKRYDRQKWLEAREHLAENLLVDERLTAEDRNALVLKGALRLFDEIYSTEQSKAELLKGLDYSRALEKALRRLHAEQVKKEEDLQKTLQKLSKFVGADEIFEIKKILGL